MRLDKNYCVGAKYTPDGNTLILESCDFINRSGYSIKMTWFYSYKTSQIWGRRRASDKKMCWTEGGIIPNSLQKSGKTKKKSSPDSQSFIYLTECKKSYSSSQSFEYDSSLPSRILLKDFPRKCVAFDGDGFRIRTCYWNSFGGEFPVLSKDLCKSINADTVLQCSECELSDPTGACTRNPGFFD